MIIQQDRVDQEIASTDCFSEKLSMKIKRKSRRKESIRNNLTWPCTTDRCEAVQVMKINVSLTDDLMVHCLTSYSRSLGM